MTVPFHVAAVGEEEAQAAAEVIRSGWLTMGTRTFEFERRFAAYVGARHAIAVCSGTAGLHLALEAAGIKAGDEVLIPATTFTATGEVVCYLGAKPVLVDVQPGSMNLDPEDAARKITARTRAMIPVHLAGMPCDMQEIHDLASKHQLHIIEDAAHSLPASYRGTPIGALSGISVFSFYATKTLTTGEGGMITTGNDAVAERMRIMRLHGIERDAWKRYSSDGSWFYQVLEAGFKYNMTDIAAAIGLVQLGKCDELCAARQAIMERYTAAFSAIPALAVPQDHSDRKSSWHLYILRLKLERLSIDRDRFIAELKQRGIGTSVHFIPLHLHPFYQKRFGYRPGDLPNAEAQYQRAVSLPIYPTMCDAEINAVIAAVSEVASSFGSK
ncbi:MAG: UDP-4-amino-4,6-dideoxy-N-acetyl-beta-L-altrosamine transaminase [Candidatus Angelobacter sp. Gp1-AA117]|nr:MAG: UDP-4-amino-4,6-dideoxy-N-acetyl-beta-L-altrosamine transaminase [Candidatus Angelobacter sp. Gp1-AA117]